MLADADPSPDALPDPLESLWWDYRRSLVRRGRSPRTIELYERKYRLFWAWALDAGVPPDPTAVDHTIINRWLDALMTTPVRRNGRTVTVTDPLTGDERPKLLDPATLRIDYRNLRPFFGWYAREFDVVNPFDKADAPGEDRPTPIPVVELDDLRRLIAACAGKTFTARRDAAILRIFADTGARLGEMANLDLADWNRRSDMLTLTGKTGTRVAPISPSTGDSLMHYVRERGKHPKAKADAMWLGTKGRLRESGVSQVLRRRSAEAGIGHVNPHRLRHTWAHEFRAAGGSEGDLTYLAGWSSTAMAARYGSSASAARAQQAARQLALGDRL